MLLSYKFFTFSQLFSQHPNKFYTENFKITAKSQSTEQITTKYPSLVTTNNNPQPPKFIPTTETTPHTTETPIQPTAANSSNQKPQPTTSKQNPPPPHNRKTTKTPPPTPPQHQKKSKSHRNQNCTQREIGSWIAGEVEGSGFVGEVEDWFMGSWVRGVKSPGRRRSRRLVGRRRWALSLSLSLFVRGRDLSFTLSLSLFFEK